MFLAALDRYIEVALREMTAVLDAPGSGLANIQCCLAFAAGEGSNTHRAWGCMVANTNAELAPTDTEVRRRLRNMFAKKEALLNSALRRAQAQGELSRDADMGAIARTLVVLMEGIRTAAKSQPRNGDMLRVVDAIMGMLPRTDP